MIKDFHGKTAVLTGAGSGFGLECARIGARLGMRLVLADVDQEALDLAAAELEQVGAEVLPFQLDVSKAAEVEALGAATLERFGAPHLVFNNAGVGAGGLVWETSAHDWEWVFGVNVMGVAHGVRVFTPMMLAAAGKDPAWHGHIVNTASMAALVNAPNMGVYNASKHAVIALTETLYHDLSLVTEQIGASVLCPFYVATGIHRSERSRPEHLPSGAATRSQEVGKAMIGKAVGSGKVSAADVAQKVFDAAAAGQFYIYSHPHALGTVQTRLEDAVQGRNPSDPFAHKPALREELRRALRG